MADVTVKSLDDFEAVFGGGFLRVRAGLGVSSFGLNVMQLPAGFGDYPDHDHTHDHQEEVYTALAGSATLIAGGEEHALEPGVWIRVGAGEHRKIVTGDEGARILAIGATPGEVYHAPEFTEEGVADPMAGKKHRHGESLPAF